MLQINDTVPDFRAETSDGATIQLSDYREKKNVILFFYPKAFSPACTKQACQFRDDYETLQSNECEIIGISFDNPDKHTQFKDANRLPYHLISDTDKSIARAYGVMRLGGFLPFVKRATFVIDKFGVIRNVIHHEYNITNHIKEVRTTLDIITETSL